MPLGDVVLRILGRDETADAVRSAEGNLDSLESGWGARWARMAAAAAAAIAATLERMAELGRAQEDRLRALDRSVGAQSDAARALRAQLVELGADPLGGDESLTAIVSTVDAQLGGAEGPHALRTALALAQFAQATGVRDSRTVGQVARSFGLGPADVPVLLDMVAAQSSSRDLGAGALLQTLRNYGPVLSQAGLGPLESLELVADLAWTGVDFSRVSPALNSAIRRAALEGGTPRDVLAADFAAIAAAESDQAGVAAGTPAFGADGTLRLVQAIRAGEVGLHAAALDLGHLAGQETLASHAAPGAAERVAAGRRILEEDPDQLVRAAVALEGSLSGIPLIGPAYSGAIDEGLSRLRRRPAEPQTIIQVYGALLDTGTLHGLVERIPFEGFPEEPLRVELEGFRDAVLGRSDPVVSGDEGRAALEITLCIEKRILDHVAHSRTS